MSQSYLFLHPAHLPLSADDLSDRTVLPFSDADELRARLGSRFPDLVWDTPDSARGEAAGRWLEFHLVEVPEGTSLSMRCSMRADYADVVQALCDDFGWVAFDQTPNCYQPHLPPFPA